MITLEKLKLYQEFDGDTDGWARSKRTDTIYSFDDWKLIDEFRLAIFNIASGNADESFREQTETRITENTDSEETRRLLWEIGKKN